MTDGNRLTIAELERIRQRAEAAGEGNWRLNGVYSVSSEYGNVASCATSNYAGFIAASRTDIPKLITEVETLITEKAAARRMLDELIGEMANAAEAGYALAPETVREDLEKIRKELIDHGE